MFTSWYCSFDDIGMLAIPIPICAPPGRRPPPTWEVELLVLLLPLVKWLSQKEEGPAAVVDKAGFADADASARICGALVCAGVAATAMKSSVMAVALVDPEDGARLQRRRCCS